MLFRAVINPVNNSHNRTEFMLDPWEQQLGRRNDVILGLGAVPIETWIVRAWPPFAYGPILTKVDDTDKDYTLFRRAIDLERQRRWDNGERFQVTSYTEDT